MVCLPGIAANAGIRVPAPLGPNGLTCLTGPTALGVSVGGPQARQRVPPTVSVDPEQGMAITRASGPDFAFFLLRIG